MDMRLVEWKRNTRADAHFEDAITRLLWERLDRLAPTFVHNPAKYQIIDGRIPPVCVLYTCQFHTIQIFKNMRGSNSKGHILHSLPNKPFKGTWKTLASGNFKMLVCRLSKEV